MATYRKKPVLIEATQWFKNGDHPQDDCQSMQGGGDDGSNVMTEGKVVRRYRSADTDGRSPCQFCGGVMRDHGWIETLEGGHIVCPGDFVITGVKGEVYACKPDIFQMTYEPVGDASES